MVIKPEWYELNKTIVTNKKFHKLSKCIVFRETSSINIPTGE